MTIYFPDISSFQGGISLSGALAVAVKLCEGTGYVNPYYASQALEAQRRKSFQLGYHFLHQGNGAAQGDFAHAHAGAVPMMVDAEPLTGLDGTPNPRSALVSDPEMMRGVKLSSAPSIADICAFTDEYRAKGGVLHWVYLPRWYWLEMGSPSLAPLAERGLLLWSSQYTSYTDAGSGAGWQPYGGMTPQCWQYTASLSFGGIANVDFSAFRGSRYAGKQDSASVKAALAEFEALSRTGKVAPPAAVLPPVRDLRVVAVGKTTVKLQWQSPTGQSPFGVSWYEIGAQYAEGPKKGQDVWPGRWVNKNLSSSLEVHQFGSIPHGVKVNMIVRAADRDRLHGSEWATVQIEITT